MHKFANPARFQRMSEIAQPWLVAITLALLGIGGYLGLFVAPPDYQQSETVRIMYIHVPAAWMATMVYATMAAGSASFLIWRHPLGDVLAQASAPIGLWFTLLTLVTGSLWGKPMWGTWWEWDARMTSVLMLFFLYLGYIALSQSLDTNERSKKVLAAMALVGVVNLPIIKFSVEWWNTLHQPASIIRTDGPTIDSAMLRPLLLMIFGFFTFYLAILSLRMRTILINQKIRRLRSQQF
ncbi:MAG: heme ABC transporter permease [Alphaproteobacteria bacterium]|nr:heme ABC transporter permease [Alphaproteobacteria bacterium]